jgi:hypothetical protein
MIERLSRISVLMINGSNRIASNQTHHRSTNDQDNVECVVFVFAASLCCHT